MVEYTREGIIIVSKDVMERFLAEQAVPSPEAESAERILSRMQSENPDLYEGYQRVMLSYSTPAGREAFIAAVAVMYGLQLRECRENPNTPYKL